MAMDWMGTLARAGEAELTRADARDLAWRLVAVVEAREFADAVAALKAQGQAALDGGRQGLLIEHGASPVLEWYGLTASPGGTAEEPEAASLIEAASAAFRPHAGDAELRALAARLEAALMLEPGSVLRVAPGEECGMLFPLINMMSHWGTYGSWETFPCDAAYQYDGEMVVVRPADPEPGPAPVLLWLSGNALVDGRHSLWGNCFGALMQNVEIRNKFYVLCPSPTTASGLVTYTGIGYRVAWHEDALWALLTEVLRRLGPEKVDPGRICVSGISLGAQGTWRLAIKYGSMLAAVVPMAGQCDWPGDSWPSGSGPSMEVLKNLSHVAVRAYHTDTDDYAGNPRKDIEWLTYRHYESTFDIQIAGVGVGNSRTDISQLWPLLAHGGDFPVVKEVVDGEEKTRPARSAELTKLDVHVRKWSHPSTGTPMELWSPKGELFELLNGGHNTSHLVHQRVLRNPLFGFADFLLEHRVPPERQWRFDAEPLIVDTTEARRALEEAWGSDASKDAAPEAGVPGEPSGPTEELWCVVGGAKEGGILVRHGQSLESPQEATRLGTGAVVVGLELRGNRLHYELRKGEGPQLGWASTSSSASKELLVKVARPAGQADLSGTWRVEVESGDKIVLHTRHLPGNEQWGGRINGHVDFSGSIHAGMVKADFPDGHRLEGRLDSEGRRLEDLSLLCGEARLCAARASWEHELLRFHRGGPWRIRAARTLPGQEALLGWYLGAQRFLPADRRSAASSFVSVQHAWGEWAKAQWELLPGSSPSRFKIRLKHMEQTDFFLGPKGMTGWYLGAQNDRDMIPRDQRDWNSSYVSVQNPVQWKDAARAEWELHPGLVPGTYKLRLSYMPDASDWAEGFWLNAQRWVQEDWRTERSSYVQVQSDENYGHCSEVEWEFEPGSSSSTYRIKVAKQPNHPDSVDCYLSASRQLTTDKRSDDSTWVSVQAPVKNGKYAEWELVPTGTPNIHRIRLHSVPDKSLGVGWYLLMHSMLWPKDFRNKDSGWACIQDPATWADAAKAEWKLHPTDRRNVYRIQARTLPHRDNMTGGWLHAIRALPRDFRSDDSAFVCTGLSQHWAGVAGVDWEFHE